MAAKDQDRLDILIALHRQIEGIDLGNEPMSPVERQLANAVLVLLNVLIDERKGPKDIDEFRRDLAARIEAFIS